VLANEGGALPEFKKSLAFRVAGILGSGQQVVSWVHIQDLCNIFTKGITDANMQGVYNAVAPHPVTNQELNLSLGKAMYGKGFIAMPVPSFVLKLMMGDRSIEVLKSTTVSADKIEKTDFNFAFSHIDEAVSDLVTQ
jgi:NAD dependent epimerase/dehydratase family enzyme